MNKNVYKEMSDMLTKFRKEHNITVVTATQIPRPRAHHVYHTRVPHDGPDIIFIDHMNKIR